MLQQWQRTYRKAIDDYMESPELYEAHMPWYLDQISNCTYRQFTTGFFYGKPSEEAQIYDNNTYLKEYTYLGIVGETNEEGLYRIEQRNKFSVGEEIEDDEAGWTEPDRDREAYCGWRKARDGICPASEAGALHCARTVIGALRYFAQKRIRTSIAPKAAAFIRQERKGLRV